MKELLGDTSDTAVIREVLDGNVNAFERLVERYESHVAGIVTKHVPTESVRAVTHDAFVSAYQSLATYKAKKPFKHWLSRIAVRCCYDFWRSHYRTREVPVSAISKKNRDWVHDVLSEQSEKAFDADARREEAMDVLRWALDHLSAQERMVLSLTALEGYTVVEAAEFLGWSLSNVKVRSFRARRKLRKVLSGVMDTG